MLENVRNLFNHNNGHTFRVIRETLENIGYTVHAEILNSVGYGVPQVRNRLFLVCIRNDVAERLRQERDLGDEQEVYDFLSQQNMILLYKQYYKKTLIRNIILLQEFYRRFLLLVLEIIMQYQKLIVL